MTIETISDMAKHIKQKYAESDPWKLSKALNLTVSVKSMGLYDGCCKGFFVMYRRIKYIVINGDLPKQLQRIVLAHEIAHCILHADQAKNAAFHDITLFDTIDHKEYEANVFAAELLLSDEDVLSVLNEDLFFFQAASVLSVPYELLDFKFRILKRRGFKVNSPITSQGDYLKKIESISSKIDES